MDDRVANGKPASLNESDQDLICIFSEFENSRNHRRGTPKIELTCEITVLLRHSPCPKIYYSPAVHPGGQSTQSSTIDATRRFKYRPHASAAYPLYSALAQILSHFGLFPVHSGSSYAYSRCYAKQTSVWNTPIFFVSGPCPQPGDYCHPRTIKFPPPIFLSDP